MAIQWLRRTWLLAAASALALTACGGGSIVSSFSPARVVAFGDSMADLGQTGSRYTVNDGTINIWTQYVANSFSLPLTNVAQGGTSYATGNARVTIHPDAAGNAATPTVTEQVDAFLAAGKPGPQDLIILSAGTADVIAEAQATINGTQSSATAVAHAQQAGIDLAAQVRRLVNAGATHVVVAGPYNLSRSPWSTQLNQSTLLDATSSGFNDKLLVSLVDLGADVLYVDAALEYNLLTSSPTSSSLTDATTIVCTSVDPGPGIGTGPGQVNSRLCTPSTIQPGLDFSLFLFADRVYPTPRGQQLFGDFAQARIRDRW
ncbi:SGNH/GDSL hydrolase family protein [Ramlibacter sp.]|uniref:SGNH/GDSL hydrolase family protein n=1 Tax=Ramlibacter sp. TaxID=1917967 RepID=UPI002631C347|nr:SGNH/GDSL hydrolase family protein [Ramlibacter sp.]MDB5953896.1 esterase-like protein [Ramlibacter sp.]